MRFGTCMLLFGMFFIMQSMFVTAHNLPIIHTTLEFANKNILLHNDGSLTFYFVPDTIQGHLVESVIILNNGSRCMFGEMQFEKSPEQGFDVPIVCDDWLMNVSVEDRLLANYSSAVNKVYEVRIANVQKRFVGNGVLHFEVQSEQETQGNSLFVTYLKLGMNHIFTGIDHIFFIIGFALMALSFMPLVRSISGFTLSHSMTLTLAALGIITLPASFVEPLIALSIVLVGVQVLRKKEKRSWEGFWLIFGFGLFHGLGFAGSIAEIGFPRHGFVTALLGFNLGVELGQLTIVLIAFPIILLLNRWEKRGVVAKKVLACGIIAAGSIWLVSRIVGNF